MTAKKRLKSLAKRKNIIYIALSLLIITIVCVTAVSGFGAKENSEVQVEKNGIKIYLSPSNQNDNTYAAGNTNEMEQCDKIAQLTKLELEKLGYTVKLGKSGEDIDKRCEESDEFGADLHIPIHTNALDGEYTGGTFVFVYSEEQTQLAQSVLSSLAPKSIGDGDRIEYRDDLYEIYTPKADTVYIECEFHDTKKGARWIINNTGAIAKAIAQGVNDYYSNSEK